jgi:hypothetical protein
VYKYHPLKQNKSALIWTQVCQLVHYSSLKPFARNTILPTSFAALGVTNKEPMVWLDGAKVLLNFLKSNYDFGKAII